MQNMYHTLVFWLTLPTLERLKSEHRARGAEVAAALVAVAVLFERRAREAARQNADPGLAGFAEELHVGRPHVRALGRGARRLRRRRPRHGPRRRPGRRGRVDAVDVGAGLPVVRAVVQAAVRAALAVALAEVAVRKAGVVAGADVRVRGAVVRGDDRETCVEIKSSS